MGRRSPSAAGRQVLGILRDLVDRERLTVIMVTHDPLAASLSDRVLFLADGQVTGELTEPTAEAVAARMTRLDPEVVLRADAGVLGRGSRVIRGAANVASGTQGFSWAVRDSRRAVVNGTAGIVAVLNGRVVSLAGFTVRRDKIVEVDILADPERLGQLDLTFLDD